MICQRGTRVKYPFSCARTPWVPLDAGIWAAPPSDHSKGIFWLSLPLSPPASLPFQGELDAVYAIPSKPAQEIIDGQITASRWQARMLF